VNHLKRHLLTGLAAALTAGTVFANEVPIGEPVEKNGMEIAAVYLQAVTMEPNQPGMTPADIHLEADIHAIKGNNNGFAEGEWMPYLGITYHIRKVGSDWSTVGRFIPMVAADGPHYADNVRLDGAGKYQLTYRIDPPSYQGFHRHTDKETGVGQWWVPFETQWEFTYVGTGKKGGY
jgi:uncharacterized protein involved in high-affinity Fe2+ transport